MPSDLNESLHDAAAKPSREAPLSAIETRLRRRRRVRHGAIGVCALALVGALGGGIAISSDDGPSIRTTQPAAPASYTAADPPITYELPDGWVESPIEPALRVDQEVLSVGTALQPSGVPHVGCFIEPEYQDDVFVELGEYTKIVLLSDAVHPASEALQETFPPRPNDFASASHETSTCFTSADPAAGWSIVNFSFQDNGRMLKAQVSFGPSSTPERQAEAYAVSNSLVVTPLTDEPVPAAPSLPTVTEPESADTAAIAAAFETWVKTPPPDFVGLEAVIEDFASIKSALQEAAQLMQNPQCYTGHVDAITRIDEDDADVIFSFFCNGQPATPSNMPGHAVKIDGVWMVSRDTVCETIAIGQARCPART